MRKRAIEEFKEQAKKRDITFWETRPCGSCGYICGFRIMGNEIYEDSCDRKIIPDGKRGWKTIADVYNAWVDWFERPRVFDFEKRPEYLAQDKKKLDDMAAFWGFKEDKI